MPPKRAALPTKERGLFQRLIQEYETKKYKLGLKTADTILKKFPEHGETLSMKGLLLGSTHRREEGIELAKKGVRLDLTSFICWHALGILHRQDKNYEEAIKCYTQALRIEGGGNINLLRESAFLQLQLRNYPPMVENRLTLLRMQPHLRMNWIGLAVARHLAGSLDAAVCVLEGYENVMRDIPDRSYEYSEALLYHASVLEEQSKFQESLDVMENGAERIVDLRAKQEAQARCLAGLGKKDEAEALWRQLIKSNPENKRYFAGLLNLLGITEGAMDSKAVEVFKGLQADHPKSTAAKRLALIHATGEDFKSQATAYIKSALVKGVPSLFSDLKSLYQDPAKQATIEEIVETLRLEWAPTTASSPDGTDPPTSYLWSLYYLAQHYSLTGDSPRALHYIDSAIGHSSTLPELHMVRARILKRSGDLSAASSAMTDARLLDGQDRFLNSKAAKYLLRTDCTEEAERIVGLFTKPDAPSPTYDLNEMQALWYLVEEAESFLRVKNYGMALKRLVQLEKTFQEFWDDQLDFHSYCMRKMTLRSYVDLVRFEDGIRSHPVYVRAATAAISIYTKLHDEPSTPAFIDTSTETEDPALTGLSESEKKKLLKKQRQAEAKRLAKQEAEAAEKKRKAEEAAANGESIDDDGPKPDNDPKGLEVFKSSVEAPLKQAERWLRWLQQNSASRSETWVAVFEVAVRERNWLLATRALKKLQNLEGKTARVGGMAIRLKSKLPDLKGAPKPIGTVIETALSSVIAADKPLATFFAELLQGTDASTPEGMFANARTALLLDRKEEAVALLLNLPSNVESVTGPRSSNKALQTTVAARTLLAELSEGSVAEFDGKAREVFPLASAFKSRETLEQEKREREEKLKGWSKGEEVVEEGEGKANGSASYEPLM
ncbi:predicted acetyltransferase [Pseudozyma hubeiensis SY62]|uniref:Predicted acetyltransferase n=1 Tax=Pseudozyma hubeiensis (strain SY62) TaxID=1305764 RepID=R9PML4_PSEHS|nr:predicted acetyltransferase [Pseudozyma hubeiensis SY62]GAC99320.1 predicted acetyltransferase [Pseudozyma hubeiensis SY62]